MVKKSITMTTNTSTLLSQAKRSADKESYFGSIFATGTWGGGTMTFQASPDGGTTKVTLLDQSGAAVSLTANGMVNIELGSGSSTTDDIGIYANLSGSAGATLAVTIFDNN